MTTVTWSTTTGLPINYGYNTFNDVPFTISGTALPWNAINITAVLNITGYIAHYGRNRRGSGTIYVKTSATSRLSTEVNGSYANIYLDNPSVGNWNIKAEDSSVNFYASGICFRLETATLTITYDTLPPTPVGQGRKYPYVSLNNLTEDHTYLLVATVQSSDYSSITTNNPYLYPDIIDSTLLATKVFSSTASKQLIGSIVRIDNLQSNMKVCPMSVYNMTNVVFNTYFMAVYDLTKLGLEEKIQSVQNGIDYFGITTDKIGYYFNMDDIIDFSLPKEIYVPATTVTPDIGIYNEYWKDYVADVYDVNTRVMECYCYIDNIDDAFREFYYYDNTLWILSKVTDWSIDNHKCKASFIKVNDKHNYIGGSSGPLAENTIRYTSTDRNIVTPYDTTAFGGLNIISNTYSGGYGTIVFDGAVTSIGANAFKNCTTLETINLPIEMTSIGNDVFYGCTGLTSINISSTVTSIGNNVFYGCSNLDYINIPSTVTSIGKSTFRDCTSLKNITLPSSLTAIAENLFNGCTSLMEINIPYGVTDINAWSFHNCTSLSSTEIPATVTSIGEGSFNYCTSLTTVTIPSSVTSIGNSSFEDCISLETVYCRRDTPPTLGTGVFTHNAANRTINVPCVGLYAYRIATNWSTYASAIGGECSEYTITYTSTNGSVVTPTHTDRFGQANILYNFYSGGTGTIGFDRPVTTIGSQAFRGCTTLRKITLPTTLNTISSNAFKECTGLTSMTISEGLLVIGDFAFYGCTGLTYATLPTSVTTIGNYAFYGCSSLGEVTLHNGILTLDHHAFGNCTSLRTIVWPSTVTTIGDGTFYHCDSLTSVTLPNTLTSIGYMAFWGCGLTSVTIPLNVTSIDYMAFWGCASLNLVVCNPIIPPTLGSSAFDYNADNRKIKVPCAFFDDYYNNANWTSYRSQLIADCSNTIIKYTTSDNRKLTFESGAFGIPILSHTFNDGLGIIELNGYTTTLTSAFYNYETLASVELPSGIKTINKYAFYKCINLSSVTLPDSLITINKYAFYNCTSLTSITLPSSVRTINSYCFQNSGLRSISIPSSVTTLGRYVFNKCFYLTTVNNNGSITILDWGTFANCPNLRTVTIPDTVTTISTDVFFECMNLRNISLPVSLTTIGNNAFYDCVRLTEITLPSTVTTIEYCAFEYCERLSSIEIPSSVTVLEDYVFAHCTNLETVILPSTLTEIGIGTFWDTGIIDIDLSSSLTTIGESAFSGSRFTSITIPLSVTSIGNWAFRGCSGLSEVICDPTTPPTLGGAVFDYNADNRKIKVPSGSVDTYKTATKWSNYADDIISQ